MSHKLLATFLLAFIGWSYLVAVMQGGGGVASAELSSNITAAATTIPGDTSIFATTDIIAIGTEKILYTGKTDTTFTGCTRGYDGTTAATHEAGARIYTTEASVLNDALGFNLAVSIESGGYWGVVMLPLRFFINTLPHLVILNVNFLNYIPELNIIVMLWLGLGIALLVVLAVQFAPIAISLVTGVFGLIRR